MAQFDHGIKKIAETTGRQLARLAGVETRAWRPAESSVQSVEKLADRVFLAGTGRDRFVVYFEFFATWLASAPWYVLAKSGLLSQRERLPTVSIAVILRRQGYRPQNGQLRLEAAGGPTQQLWYKEVLLWTLKPEAWWEDEPGLMALYPLCDHQRKPRDAIAHAAGVIEAKVPAATEQGTYLALLAIFGELGFPKLDTYQIIGVQKMKESRFYQQVMRDGELVGRRDDVLRVLRARFRAAPPADLASAVDAIDDAARLQELIDLAATCPSLDAFREALHQESAS